MCIYQTTRLCNWTVSELFEEKKHWRYALCLTEIACNWGGWVALNQRMGGPSAKG